MEYVKHIYSQRVYQVRRDHNPDKPYLSCPEESVVRYLPTSMVERFFTPCKDPYSQKPEISVKQEIQWEKDQMARDQPPKPLEAPQPEKPKKATKPTPERKVPPEAAEYTLRDLCSELGIPPAVARKILRSQGKGAPEGGWKWPDAEAAKEIKKILKKFL